MQSNVDCVMIDNEYPESWFEIYNPLDREVSLKNYRISNVDDYTKTRDINPNATIQAHGYYIVACDASWSRDHATFRLDIEDGGSICLFAGKKLIDKVSYSPMIAPGVAYARIGDGSEKWGYEVTPTPEASNDGPFSSVLLGDPVFSHVGGLFTSSFSLEITLPEGEWPSDTRIYYTFDGSEPTFESQNAESLKLSIDSSMVIRAKLMSKEALSGRSVTHSYIFHERDIDMYVFSLVTDSSHLYDKTMGIITRYGVDWRRPVNIECFDPISNKTLIHQLGETALSGGGSRSFNQKSMKCYAKKWFGTKRFKGVFWEDKPNVSENKSFILRNGGNNCLYAKINDAFVQKLFGTNLNNLDWQAYRPAVVYINGIYKGLFGMRERSNDDYVYANFDGLEAIEVAEANHYVSKTPPTRFRQYRDVYCRESTSYATLDSLMDVDNFIKALIAEMYSSNTDYPTNNISMWRPTAAGGKWRWILKDLDYMARNDVSHDMFKTMFKSPTGSLSYENGVVSPGSYTLYRKMISYPEFRNLFIKQYSVYLGDFLKPSVAVSLLDDMMNEIKEELNSTRIVYDNRYGWQNSWNRIKNYCNQRSFIVYSQMADFFSLGSVIPMKVINNGHEIQVDSIPLVQGDFEGAWFSDYPLSVQTGASNYGWRMTVFSTDTLTYDFDSPSISLTLNEYGAMDSVRFEPIQLNVSEFEQKIADLGIESGGSHNLSDALEVILPEPSCAYANITGIDELPRDKTDFKHAYIDFYDNEGNYFKKKVILSVQGKSEQLKKNLSISFCEDDWVGSETPDIYFGDWVKQDEFHLKAFYNDYFRGIPAIGYELYNNMVLTHNQQQYPWQRGLTESDRSNPDLNIYDNARCFPDAFPCVIYFNGDYYGTFAWQLKKQRRNMNLTKNVATHIHLDGTLNDKQLFKGNVNWTKFEVRNPKDLYNMDGTDYDGDNPQELIDATSSAFKNKKKMLRCVEVKQHILELSNYYSEIASLISSGASDDEVRAAIDARFDITSLVDYMILSLVTSNYKGFSKNWQWFTYDGKKWFVTPYDLDLSFGYNDDYESLWPASQSSDDHDYKMEDVDSSGPMLWIKNYYWEDLKIRYAELRQQGVISTSNIMSVVNDWYSRIGNENYDEEYLRWPQSPCVANFSDGLDRIEQWISERINLEDSYLGYEGDYANYTLAVTECEWATVCVPFAFEIPADMEVYTVQDVEEDGLSLVLEKQEFTTANKPYLVHAPKSAYLLSGEFVDASDDNSLVNGLLTGTYSSIIAPQYSYVLQYLDGVTGFYRVPSDNYLSVSANHAYLTVPSTVSKAHFRLSGDDSVIEQVGLDGYSANGQLYYDISGRRIGKPAEGLNLMHSADGSVQKIYIK